MLADLTGFLSFLGASLKQAAGIGKRPEFNAIKESGHGMRILKQFKKKKPDHQS